MSEVADIDFELRQPPSLWLSWRGMIVYLCLLCNTCLYLCRTCITVAIVYMFKDPAQQGVLLSAFYAGYTVSQVPGGWLAKRHGPYAVLSVAVLLWSTVTIATIYFGTVPSILFILRFLVGCAEGVNYPCQMQLNTNWAPHNERSRTWALGMAGESIGTIMALIGGPYLIHEYDSWKAVFVVSGLAGYTWLAIFLLLGSSKPENHTFISDLELHYIIQNRNACSNNEMGNRVSRSINDLHDGAYINLDDESLPSNGRNSFDGVSKEPPGEGKNRSTVHTPWKRIACNRPFQVAVITHCCYNYGYYVVLSWISDFFKSEFNTDYKSMGFVSIMPFVLLFITNPLGGILGDYFENHLGLTTLTMRRVINTVAMGGASVGFLCVGLLAKDATTVEKKESNLYPCAIVLAITMAIGGLMSAGVWSNFRDLSSEHAGVLVGISNSVASLPGIVGQSMTGLILKWSNNDWFTIFALAAGIEMCGCLTFCIGAVSNCLLE